MYGQLTQMFNPPSFSLFPVDKFMWQQDGINFQTKKPNYFSNGLKISVLLQQTDSCALRFVASDQTPFLAENLPAAVILLACR